MCFATASHKNDKPPQSSTATLPLEIIEMIIAPLVYDIPSLRACSLTCYSWYIASVPQLHHTFPAPLDYYQCLGDLKFASRFVVPPKIRDKGYVTSEGYRAYNLLKQPTPARNVQYSAVLHQSP